ncbi:uncharacterized protein [Physcomitrium patens]|uniref:uncharacterized protein isoform X1 n=1 Tax=Physcomitrium patens TaxID=3218 RepID=UPI00024B004C
MTPLESYGTKMWMEHKSQTFKIATLHKPSVCTNLSGVSRENILSSVRNDGGRAGLTSTGLDTHGIARDLGHTACSGASSHSYPENWESIVILAYLERLRFLIQILTKEMLKLNLLVRAGVKEAACTFWTRSPLVRG